MHPAEKLTEKLTIIGSGPAAFTAALYASRANLKPLLFSGFKSGGVPGGQLMTTTEVENYPGFPQGITGPELMRNFEAQAVRFGTRILGEDVVAVDLGRHPFRVRSSEREVETHALIIATGAYAKRLGLPNEETLWNRGISACAVCDGALPLFRNQDLVVVGGGDTAVEEASYLTKFGKKVYLVHRRDALRASKIMQERAFKNPKIELIWDHVVIDAEGKVAADGKEMVSGARLRNVKNNAERTLPAGGIFYAIGHEPNVGFLNGQVKTDETGYIVVQPQRTLTSVEGVFAAGDVVDKVYRQAVTAAGMGCMAALDAERWLAEREGH